MCLLPIFESRPSKRWLIYVTVCSTVNLALVFAAENGLVDSPPSSVSPIESDRLKKKVELAVRQAREHAANREFGEAIDRMLKALTLAKGLFGPDDKNLAYILYYLAKYHHQSYKRDPALNYAEKTATLLQRERGSDTVRQASVMRDLGRIFYDCLRPDQAKALFEKAIAIYEKLNNDVDAARATIDLAKVLIHDEALEKAGQYVSKAHKVFQSNSSRNIYDLASADILFARIKIKQSKLKEAEKRVVNALKYLNDSPFNTHYIKAEMLEQLGYIKILEGKELEAENIYKEIWDIYKKALGEEHPATARPLHSLAIVNKTVGKYAEAELLYQQALAIQISRMGNGDPLVADTRLEYALLLTEWGRVPDAINQAEQALEIYSRLAGNWDVKRGYASSARGFALHQGNQREEAAEAFERAIKLIEESRGNWSLDLPPGLIELSDIYIKQGRFEEAEEKINRALEIQKYHEVNTPRHLVRSLSLRAKLRQSQGRLDDALEESNKAVTVLNEYTRIARSISSWREVVPAGVLSASGLLEQEYVHDTYIDHIHLLSELFRKNRDPDLIEMSFETAQHAQISNISQAVDKMAARFAKNDDSLGKLVRERQDLTEQWQTANRLLDEIIVKMQATKSHSNIFSQKRDLEERIQEADKKLNDRFPRYSELTNPDPLSIAAARELLGPKEAMLVQITTEEVTYLWLLQYETPITFIPKDVNIGKLDLLVEKIINSVRSPEEEFDARSAYDLYRILFADLPKLLDAVEHLIFIPDGPLQRIPLGLLLTEEPTTLPTYGQGYSNFPWLARQLAISLLPSVSSVKAQKIHFGSSGGWRSFFGIGTERRPYANITQQLRDLSRALGGDSRDLFLGKGASKEILRTHPELHSFRVLGFGTDIYLATKHAEPALVLMPQQHPGSRDDDGLFTASEVAQLKLNADWVILLRSPKENLNDPQVGRGGLSSLTRAFIYAGTRSLLVPYWPPPSETVEMIVARSLELLADDSRLGRSVALNQAMQPFIQGKRGKKLTHPYFWASFSVIGDGGVGIRTP